MVTPGKPAVSLAAVPGRRQATIDMARRLEQEGFTGLYCPSLGDGLGLCEAIALGHARRSRSAPASPTSTPGTRTTSPRPRPSSTRSRAAASASESASATARPTSGSASRPGKPLEDMRRFVDDLKTGAKQAGELPPIVLATLRKKMVALAGEIAQGAVWANAARSHMPASLAHLPEAAQAPSPLLHRQHGADLHRRRPRRRRRGEPAHAERLREAAQLPELLDRGRLRGGDAGHPEGHRRRGGGAIPALMSDRWLSEVTLYGSAAQVREGVEAWYAAGVKTLIVVPSSTAATRWWRSRS